MSNWSDEHGSDITQYESPENPTDQTAVKAIGTLPLAGGFITHGINNLGGIAEGDSGWAEISGGIIGAAAGAADFGIKVEAMHGSFRPDGSFNPLTMLVSFGLDLVLAFVTPLDDLLKMVSGDAGQMQKQIDEWEKVKVALQALSDEVAEQTTGALPNWGGSAAESAATSIERLCQAITAMAKGADGVQATLAWAQALANFIYELIKAILAEIITELIITGTAALAASGPTFGGSVATFLLNAAKAAGKAILRAIRKVFTVTGSYGKLLNFLTSPMGGAVVSTIAGSIQPLLAHGFDGQSQSSAAAQGNLDTGMLVELEEFTEASNCLSTQAANAASIQETVADMASTDMTWGICGLLFAEAYNHRVTGFDSDIRFVADSLDGHADKMNLVREDYEATDQAAADEFDRVTADLDG